MKKFEIERSKNYHMLGIGGCGVSAIAKVMHLMGYKVTGSDAKESPNTIRLKDLGIKVFIGHDQSQIREADVIVVSSAIRENNPELLAAKDNGLPIIKRAEMLAWIMDQFPLRIAVAGTHGKTTTTSMIAKVLSLGEFDPTYLIGGEMDYVDGNARLGKGRYIVAEADESDGTFLFLSPNIEIITNIEADHMEYYGTLSKVKRTFRSFVDRLPAKGKLIINIDQPANRDLLKKVECEAITYGFDKEAQVRADNIRFNKRNAKFDVYRNGEKEGEARLIVPGYQNVQNSLAAFAVGFDAGLDFSTIAGALQTFVGARRRFQLIGEQGGITIIDDYAHHPTEIIATLKAARSGWPERRLIAVFQPHRYTRTMFLMEEFSQAFADADLLIITDIYSAGEKPIEGITGKTLADEVKGKKPVYIPKKENIVNYLVENVKSGDMLFTLGAGDIYTVGREVLARLKM